MLKKAIFFAIIVLLGANVFLFVSSINLGDNVARYEKEINRIHQQNVELQKNVAYFDSMQYAASSAANLDFTQKEAPIYLDNLRYALNR